MARIRVVNDGAVVDSPGADEQPWAGLPGSLLSRLLGQGYLMPHVCGGQLACGTCHIYIHVGAEHTSAPSVEEADWLDTLVERRPESRLACQCVIGPRADVTVEVVE